MVKPGARVWLLVLAVALAASVTSVRNGFVYDDVPAVANDARIHSLAHFRNLFALPYWDDDVRDRIYRPATTVSFATDWAAGGGSPFPFHLTNVLLHLAVCALVFALARRALGAGPGALVGALWFAVHPVHVEAVANIVGRSELLAALGYLGAVIAYGAEGEAAERSPGGARRAWLAVLTLACAALAYGGKEHALTLPAALLLADAWGAATRRVEFGAMFRRHAVTWAGAVALVVGYLAARHAVLGTTFGGGSVGAGLEGLGAVERATVMAPAVLVWARLLVVPLALSADYSPNHFVPTLALTPAHLAGAALVIGAAFTAFAVRRRAPAVTFAIAWIAITAAVATNVAFPTGVLLAERVLYLPSVGVALLVGAAWGRLRGPAVWPATAVLLAALATRSLARIPVWRDGERFYAALVHDAPDSYRSHWATGARAFEQNHAHEGEAEMLQAIRIYPGEADLLQELGAHYLAAGLNAPADRMLTAVLSVDSLHADAAVGAVIARTRLGHPDSAVALGDAVLRRFPEVPALLLATGDAVFALGKPALALTYRRRMVYAFPDNWRYQYLAAEGAARAARCEEARWRLDRSSALAPRESAPRRLRQALGSGPTCRVPA